MDSLPVESQGSPRILEWVAYPFSSGSSWPRNRTGVSCTAGEFFYQLSYQGSQVAFKKLVHILLKFTEFHYRKMYKKFFFLKYSEGSDKKKNLSGFTQNSSSENKLLSWIHYDEFIWWYSNKMTTLSQSLSKSICNNHNLSCFSERYLQILKYVLFNSSFTSSSSFIFTVTGLQVIIAPIYILSAVNLTDKYSFS